MIQVQRAYGSGSDNITIRDNVFDMGQGDFTQTIWMGGDGKDISDPKVIHHNVLIEGNIIYNGHFHGVSIYGVDGLTVTKNSVLHVDDKTLTGGIEIPVINISSGSKNVTIDHNAVSQVLGYNGQSDWNVSNNALIQPNQYDQMFTYHATAAADGQNQYGVKPGSLVDTLNAGSDLVDNYPFSYDTWVGTTSTTSTNTGTTGTNTGGTGTTTTNTGGTGTTTTDTSGTNTGGTGTTTTTATDTSGTNTGGTGTTSPVTTETETTQPETVEVETSEPETNETETTQPETVEVETSEPETNETETTQPETVEVETSEPETNETETTQPETVEVETSEPKTTETETTQPETVDVGTASPGTGSQAPMVFDDFVLDIAGLPGKQASLKGDAALTTSGDAITFDGHRDWVKIGKLKEFENSEQIAFTVEFTRDEADSGSQWLVWNHTKLGLNLTADGGLIAHVKNNDSPGHTGFRDGFRINDLGLDDTETHTITLMLDEVADRLQIVVDGELVFENTDTDFQFSGGHQWGWSIGTDWGRYVDGEVSAFAIDDDVQFIEDQSVVTDDLFA